MPININCPLLARFPEVGSLVVKHKATDHTSGGKQPFDGRRLIGQALSFKLLGGATLALLLAAVVPHFFKHPTSAVAPPEQTLADSFSPRSNLADEPAIATGRRTPARPATVVAAVPEQAAEMAPPIYQPNEGKSPTLTAEEPRMSPWPNSDQNPQTVQETPNSPRVPPAGQPYTVGSALPPAYEADARAAGSEQVETKKY